MAAGRPSLRPVLCSALTATSARLPRLPLPRPPRCGPTEAVGRAGLSVVFARGSVDLNGHWLLDITI